MSINGRRARPGLVVAIAVGSVIGLAAPAAADDGADRILKAMSDYLASQKTISATFDSDIEVITPDLQKIQFDSSGTIFLNRPNEIHATRTGGYSDVELFFDGKTLTVYGKNINSYAQKDAPGSLSDLVETLRQNSFGIPGADLLLPDAYKEMMAPVIDSKHIGLGVIGGVECEHLAFRTQETDWQIWIETGANPIPRKLVITSKAIGAAPQYTLVIKDWQTDAPADPSLFAFKAPEGAKEIAVDELKGLDELPPGAPAKGQ